MAAMMVLMVVLMAGPYHVFMGSHGATPQNADAPHMQTDRTANPQSNETPEA